MPYISPQAMVAPGAKLAEDVIVGPFAYVGPEVRLGAGCVIEASATVVGRTDLGAGSRVFPLAVIGAAPDDGERAGTCRIGRANRFREHVTVYGGLDRPTVLGESNLVMIASQIGPGAEVGDHGIFANCTRVGRGARVEDYVHTGGYTSIGEGVRVGTYTFAAGYVEIQHDAPPYATVQGFPFRVRGVNSHKLRRCGFGDDDIRALKDAFRELFNGHGPAPDAEALRRLDAQAVNPHVRRLVRALQEHAVDRSADD